MLDELRYLTINFIQRSIMLEDLSLCVYTCVSFTALADTAP